MDFFSILKRRTARALICLRKAIPKALAIQSALMFILVTFSYFYLGGTVKLGDLLAAMLVFFVITWIACFCEQIARYGSNIFHRYDEPIIGKAFADLSKSSAVFELGMEQLNSGDIKEALLTFTELDSEKYRKTQEEQAVLSFFRGRCYHLLNMYPNALINYEKARDTGFKSPLLPLFYARCCVGNGEINRAVKLYTELLDSDYEHADIVRTDLGRAYLEVEDGENALKWYREALDKHENYEEALCGTAIAMLLLKRFDEAEKYYRAAILNGIDNADGYEEYYKRVKAMMQPDKPADTPDKGGEE